MITQRELDELMAQGDIEREIQARIDADRLLRIPQKLFFVCDCECVFYSHEALCACQARGHK